MNKFFSTLALTIFFISSTAWSHALLTYPPPRNNNAGIKTGPCGGLPRSANPTTLQGGQFVSVTWRETINHPGRFIFSLSTANDSNFAQNRLATVVDTMDDNNTPHNYITTIQIPDINCETCTLQMIQSMEENPNSPTYYYSCADIRIVASTPPANSPPVGSLTNNGQNNAPKMASCGLVSEKTPPPSGPQSLMYGLLLLIPLLLALKMRMIPARINRRKNDRY